jgi:hypothetical protein
VVIALREFIEMLVSVGVMTVFTAIYYFNRWDYYMIDVASKTAFRNAWLTAGADFATELLVYLVFDRMVYRLWKVSLLDLAQAYIRSIGKFEMYALTSCCVMYIFLFMNYHFGCDYFFNFEWMTEENLEIASAGGTTKSWCDLRQEMGVSCYSWIRFNTTMNGVDGKPWN